MVVTVSSNESLNFDNNLIDKAKELFSAYGLSLSEGINLLLKQFVKKQSPILDIEMVNKEDPDYELIKQSIQRRKEGEKVYSLDEVLKEFDEN